jgi:hypothetical protein
MAERVLDDALHFMNVELETLGVEEGAVREAALARVREGVRDRTIARMHESEAARCVPLGVVVREGKVGAIVCGQRSRLRTRCSSGTACCDSCCVPGCAKWWSEWFLKKWGCGTVARG